jgi:hypothetical protein
MIPAFGFQAEALRAMAGRHREAFRTAQPFEHVVIDDFLPPDIAELLADEFPPIEHPGWRLWGPGEIEHTQDRDIEKVGTADEAHFGPLTRHVMAEFNSQTFLGFLSELTGFRDLLGDPHYFGCGLHSTGRGGRLMVHVDANRFPIPTLDLHQRINLILYLNRDWKEEYGGHLELWDGAVTRCVRKILPAFNRCVIFHTSTRSYHGHPAPLTCPPGRRRNSLALYYYTPRRRVDSLYDGLRRHVEWRLTRSDERPRPPRRGLLRRLLVRG